MKNRKTVYHLAILLIFNICTQAQNLTTYVDPFIGIENGGNVFVGACMPFGMVKLGPDCNENHSNSGYEKNGIINGFSHTHVSGTGGGAKYGNILFLPFIGQERINGLGSEHSNDIAKPGYFSTFLTKYNIKAELTASHSVGCHQYSFPENENVKIFIDLGHFLISGIGWGEEQFLVGSEIKLINDTIVEGYSRVRGGWTGGSAYTVYFHAVFDHSFKNASTFKGNKINLDSSNEYDSGEATGMFISFGKLGKEQLHAKVGVSFISIGKATANLYSEINHLNFNRSIENARVQWENILSKIKIETSNNELKTMFYTAMYHATMMPVNRTGENPLWKSEEPYYDDFYAIWDTYRSSNSLFTLILPETQRDILRSMLDIYKHEGYMPDARSGNVNGRTQGGSNSDVLITDAYVKGLKGIDYKLGLQAMLKNAEISPGGNEQKEGRGGLKDYNNLGYVSTDYERAGSRTVEYAYNDFCISILAKGLGKDSIYNKYIKQSNNWENLWNNKISDHGAKGFIWPRQKDGSWVTNFSTTQAGSWNDFFYESHSWEYSLYVPHDVNKLIEVCGGNEAFLNRLDTFFVKRYSSPSLWKYDFFNVSNEPGFLTPCLYTWAGRPDKTSETIRQTIKNYFNTTLGGIPGNDDSGAMSSWLVFGTMGFFPNAGQDIYFITSPHFQKVIIELAQGKQFVISTNNLSEKNRFIKSATLNGKAIDRAWFKHNEIINGAELMLEMTDKPTNWGQNNLPPSLSKTGNKN